MNGFSKMGLVECVPKKRDKLSGFSKKGMNLMKKGDKLSGFPNKGRSWVSLNSSWKPPSQPAGVAAGGGSRETDTSTWNKTGGSTQRHALE